MSTSVNQQPKNISNLEQVNYRNRVGQVKMMNAKKLESYSREYKNPTINNELNQNDIIDEYWDWQFEISGKR